MKAASAAHNVNSRIAAGPILKEVSTVPQPDEQMDLFEGKASEATAPPEPKALRLIVHLDMEGGFFQFEWIETPTGAPIAGGQLTAAEPGVLGRMYPLEWRVKCDGKMHREFIRYPASSINGWLKRLEKQFPVASDKIVVTVYSPKDIGPLQAGKKVLLKEIGEPLKFVSRQIQKFAKCLADSKEVSHEPRGGTAMEQVVLGILVANGDLKSVPKSKPRELAKDRELRLLITFSAAENDANFEWSESGKVVATGRVAYDGRDRMSWLLQSAKPPVKSSANDNRLAIKAELRKWQKLFPVKFSDVIVQQIQQHGSNPTVLQKCHFTEGDKEMEIWLARNLQGMARTAQRQDPPLARILNEQAAQAQGAKVLSKAEREQKRMAQVNAVREKMRLVTLERRRRETKAAQEKVGKENAAKEKAAQAKATQTKVVSAPKTAGPSHERANVPAVPVCIELPALEFKQVGAALPDLRNYFLRERAANWWVSNQSDDLLCLPHCRVQRLDYQVRTALRVLGPLRGRALLADEVGLGKTVEAGLVLKELLTRGMVKRYLILTVPSLVDQWEEELADKFNLTTVTTNHPGARDDAQSFWGGNPAIIASLHTLKQPAQLAVAREVAWDLLIVDEAHHLRNRDSQAWQAVNVLPRQFLLLLTATPVQNSLEELYNLVTLLQPGQLPTPKEFRARFFDPKKPRQPKEPEELRRLLGQVMIRNTRANAGLNLPSRRAETALFEASENERVFWQEWESELRRELEKLSVSQAILWGRLLLQAAGSSPAAWREALVKFPGRAAAEAWTKRAPLEESWQKKCALLVPLARTEGGAVIFTQFLQTQAAMAEALRHAGVETFVINGSIPAAERQPITEEFRKRGGALLLTKSGSEGRNLQFSHCLVNFDLPWNPMEIEQRIGRLHRLGQKRPVHIYNLVQAGTLQEHLLTILQEKLNLFELVVGETGLILGEKFGSDEFSEEILRRWRESEGRVAESLQELGEELALARDTYGEVKKLDETLFAKDYESL